MQSATDKVQLVTERLQSATEQVPLVTERLQSATEQVPLVTEWFPNGAGRFPSATEQLPSVNEQKLTKLTPRNAHRPALSTAPPEVNPLPWSGRNPRRRTALGNAYQDRECLPRQGCPIGWGGFRHAHITHDVPTARLMTSTNS